MNLNEFRKLKQPANLLELRQFLQQVSSIIDPTGLQSRETEATKTLKQSYKNAVQRIEEENEDSSIVTMEIYLEIMDWFSCR